MRGERYFNVTSFVADCQYSGGGLVESIFRGCKPFMAFIFNNKYPNKNRLIDPKLFRINYIK